MQARRLPLQITTLLIVPLRYPMSVNLEAVFRIRFSKFGLGLYMNSLEIFSEYSNPSFSSLFKSVRAVWRTTLYV